MAGGKGGADGKGAARRGGARTVATLVAPMTRRAFAERGFHETAALAEWAAIVGDDLAGRCAPERLGRDGTLVLRCAGAAALEIQHMEPLILDRLASYFGYRAVTRLSLRQGPLPAPRTRRVAAADPATAELPESTRQAIESVGDPDLRAALERVGARIAAAARRPAGRG